MLLKIRSHQPAFLMGLVGLATAILVFLGLVHGLPGRAATTKTVGTISGQAGPNRVESASAQKRQVSDLPIRLTIPKIKVDTPLEQVGVTPDGAVDVPKDLTHAAWFDQGPRPGEKGNAVIDGHFGWKGGIQGVFDTLHRLRPGDTLSVEDNQGKTTTFIVRELRTYGRNEDSAAVFNASDGQAHLNLITCDGVWDRAKQSFSNRLVVFSDEMVQ